MNIAINDAVAILIDAENVNNHDCLEKILKFAEYYGYIIIRRAYGDWSNTNLVSFPPILERLSIEKIQVDQIGKNATDNWLIAEAGTILEEYQNKTSINFTTFIIVAGDGDYASPVGYLQNKWMKVIGIGRKGSISPDLKDISNKFYTIEQLDDELEKLQQQHPIPPNKVRAFAAKLAWAYGILREKHNDDWVNLGELGQELRNITPDYDSQFGHHQLSKWMNSLSHEYEHEDQKTCKIDHNPDFTRYQMLIGAFLECKADQVSCSQLEDTIRKKSEKRFERYFDGKKLTDWLAPYARFSVENNMVSINQNKSIFPYRFVY